MVTGAKTKWTTPDDIRLEVERLWARGALLAALHERIGLPDKAHPPEVSDADQKAAALTFPLKLRLRRPTGSDLGIAFERVRRWIAELEAASRAQTGAGFEITWEEINSRQLGRNRMPLALALPRLEDALSLIDRTNDAQDYRVLTVATLEQFPELAPWLALHPLTVLEHRTVWAQLLDCVSWFKAHPRSGLYARQIDIAGIDTKFIETHKRILAELLDRVLPPDAFDSRANGTAAFEARYGLAAKPPLVRVRALDSRLAIGGLTDLTVRIDELAALDLCPDRVFVVENEITGLAFPPATGALLLFGGGYGVEQLAPFGWLRSCPIVYWGDIDTHGFAILDRLRALFPQVRSMLMDRDTLLAFRAAWSFEAAPHVANLSNLTPEEMTVYDDLRRDRHGPGVRLEQERVSLQIAKDLIDCI
jgi:hypothetical protein